MTVKTNSSPLISIIESNKLKRNVSPVDMQIGYPGQPAELHVTGRFSQSVATVEVEPGRSAEYPGNVTVLFVKRKSGSSGSITIGLPISPREGQVCYVKDASGTAAVNPVVVNSKSLIDGSSSRTITKNYGCLVFTWTGKTWSSMAESPDPVASSNTYGTAGPAGPTGPQGQQGDQGDAGTTGATGADGNDAYTIILSPDSVVLPADNSGTPTSYASSATSITVFKGATELNGVTVGTPTTGQFSVSAAGTSITPGSSVSSGNPVEYGAASSMSSMSATITYTINLENSVTVTRKQTFSVARKGDAGATGPAGGGGKSIITFGAGSTSVTNGAIRYLYPGFSSTTASDTVINTTIPFAGTLSALYVQQNAGNANAPGDEIGYKLLINGSTGNLSTVVSTGATSSSNTSDSDSVSAGNTIALKIESSNSSGRATTPTNIVVTLLLS